MDTLSTTSVTNFQVPKTFSPIAQNHRTISPVRHHLSTTAGKSSISTTAGKSSSAATFQQKDNFTPLYSTYSKRVPPYSPPRTLPFRAPRATAHRRAASGYAAALVDVAQCNGVVFEVERDVRRLLKVLRDGHVEEFMRDEMVEEREKGEVVKEVVEKGRFQGHLVGLVKMVIEKGRKWELIQDMMI
ncbi:hypothetical protein Cgig2_031035 [Carnegiea gigantea]|uniref:Uncharacterized protein n=1 Tax=Carnegiea gigantea TaxID=171969 RepID=A0A9Q1KC49_9CARY|nr:hypothetical protein Cgig2_031035 [Carnegiea gigantea]